MRTLEKDAKCEYEGCDKPAEYIAVGRRYAEGYRGHNPGHPGIGLYCEEHTDKVEDEGSPEYLVTCDNCGCHFGVN